MHKKNGPNLHCWYNDVCPKSILQGIVRKWAMLPVDLFLFSQLWKKIIDYHS